MVGMRDDAEWPFASRGSVAKVSELQRHAKIRLLEKLHDGLQIVAFLARHADLLALDRRLHLELGFLDRLDDLTGLIRVDAIL